MKYDTLRNVKFMEKKKKKMKVRGIALYLCAFTVENRREREKEIHRAIINLRKQVLILHGTIARCLLTGCKIALLCFSNEKREREREKREEEATFEIQLDHVLLLGPPTMVSMP